MSPGLALVKKIFSRAVRENFNHIPDELKALPQWECWRVVKDGEKDRKIPINAHTGQRYPKDEFTSEKMGTASFDVAFDCFDNNDAITGVGFRFKESDPYCGVDLDDCRDRETGELDDRAAEIVREFATYTEVSPSGTGVKMFCRGRIPSAITKTFVSETLSVEAYSDGRFFAITGQVLEGFNTIRPAQPQLDKLYAEFKGKATPATPTVEIIPGEKWKSGGEHYERLRSFVGSQHYHDPAMTEDEGLELALQHDQRRALEPYPLTKVRELVHGLWQKKDDDPHAQPVAVDPDEWRKAFHKISELAAGKPEAIIEGYFEEGLSFLGAKSGVGKTWMGIGEGQALRTGKPFLGVFPVPQRRPVVYLIPEMTDRRFRNRCELLGIDIDDPEFLIRTMNDGAPMPLSDPLIRACVKELRPVVYLDTAVRFGGGKEENSAGEVSQGLIHATYQLIQLGAPAVRALHHRAKDASDEELTLENVLRGSGDFGASAVCVWGVAHETALRAGRLAQFDTQGRKKPDNVAKQKLERDYLKESKRLGRCYLECVKPGDRELLLWDFRIQLRPSIDDEHKIEMLSALPLAASIDPEQVVEELLTANPDSSVESLAKALNVSRTTAYRRATDCGWTFDAGNRIWTR
jgi:hypothetical protein